MMMLIRRFEERTYQEYTKPGQKIGGFCHLYSGQEAVAVGIAAIFQKGKDYLINGYRCHGHSLALGMEPHAAMAELFGRATGCSKGKGGSMHFFQAEVGNMGGHGIVGGQIPLGCRDWRSLRSTRKPAAYVLPLRRWGDQPGHISTNRSTWPAFIKLPVHFHCRKQRRGDGHAGVAGASAEKDLVKRGSGFNMPLQSDRWKRRGHRDRRDERSRRPRPRAAKGRAYIVANTYRFRGHSMSDAMKYRTKEEAEQAQLRDPIALYEARLREKGLLTDEQVEAIEEEVSQLVDDAVK